MMETKIVQHNFAVGLQYFSSAVRTFQLVILPCRIFNSGMLYGSTRSLFTCMTPVLQLYIFSPGSNCRTCLLDDPSKTTPDPKIVQHKSHTFPSSHCIFCCSCLLPHLFSPSQCSLQMFEIESSRNSEVWICNYLSAGTLKVLKTVSFSYCFAQYRHSLSSESVLMLAKVNVF